jgi:hypothetical protein
MRTALWLDMQAEEERERRRALWRARLIGFGIGAAVWLPFGYYWAWRALTG